MQVNAITTMIGILLSCKSHGFKDYETLITKVTQYAARLLKKVDQCKMVVLCSHLFFVYGDECYKNSQRTLECLQRSLKVANICVTSNPGNLQLFVDILDIYLYHFEKQNPMVADKYISGLIALVNEHIASIGGNPAITDAKAQFVQIVKYIEEKKSDARFSGIVCNIPV
jgi:vacuolar protein sorting-associated protein 35